VYHFVVGSASNNTPKSFFFTPRLAQIFEEAIPQARHAVHASILALVADTPDILTT
jgi:hypothetical protein